MGTLPFVRHRLAPPRGAEAAGLEGRCHASLEGAGAEAKAETSCCLRWNLDPGTSLPSAPAPRGTEGWAGRVDSTLLFLCRD